MIRKTILLDEELFSKIEDYRSRKRPIPSFNEAVVELLRKALEVGD